MAAAEETTQRELVVVVVVVVVLPLPLPLPLEPMQLRGCGCGWRQRGPSRELERRGAWSAHLDVQAGLRRPSQIPHAQHCEALMHAEIQDYPTNPCRGGEEAGR